ncbi:helix-turn-helix domain-containing protein [Nocardioides sp. LHD-245]|uniref:PucR family transcriptional regulator n=1 Tax=Nocardioides sp. LHD-245 TaxID=3051387 RepID=UPI0027E19DCF|nr:helix-turn-helix domain-containing protein [Nocardioides sp. LHD-245]
MTERVPPDLQRLARAMLKEFDDLMTRIVDEVWASVPAYAELVFKQGELRERIRENVHTVIVCLLEGRAPTSAELARASLTGERRALQGVSPSSVIQSFRTAERALNDEYFDWCSRMQVQQANIRKGRATLISSLDQLEHAMLTSHLEIQHQIEEGRRLSEPALFRSLAAGGNVDRADVERLAVTMGIDDPEHASFVTLALGTSTPADRAAMEQHRHHVVGRLRNLLAVPVLSGTVQTGSDGWLAILAMPWEAELDLLAQRVTAALKQDAAADLRASVGEPFSGLSGLGTSCRQAVLTLESRSGRETPAPVVLFRDSLLEVLIHRDGATARQLVQRYLSRLQGTELLLTLTTHLDHDLSVRATSEALHVHKNTVVYRLRRIEELTGLNLRTTRDLALLVLATEADRAAKAAGIVHRDAATGPESPS